MGPNSIEQQRVQSFMRSGRVSSLTLFLNDPRLLRRTIDDTDRQEETLATGSFNGVPSQGESVAISVTIIDI